MPKARNRLPLLRTLRLVPVALAVLALGAVGPRLGFAAAEDRREGHHILVLNSYHPGFLWSDNEQTGALDELAARLPDAELHVEYLDTRNFPALTHYPELRRVLARKYGGLRLSAILALDDAALDFLAAFGRPLFGDAPVVFCGVSHLKPQSRAGLPHLTGLLEKHALRPTLEAMLRLDPGATEIYALVDDAPNSRETLRQAKALLPGLSGKVKLTFPENPTIEEALGQIRRLGPDSLVLLLPFARDRNGRVFGNQELTRLVGSASPVPVYVLREERMGPGVMGGYLLEGRSHGRQAARLALRVLGGEEASSIPIAPDEAIRPIFDFTQLQRFGIRESALPQGSVVLHRPSSLYENHREAVWTTVGFILVLLGVIGALLNNIRRRRAVEEVLRQNRAMLREVLDRVPQSIFWKDRESVYLGCNAVFAGAAGLADPEQIVGKTDFDLVWPREEAEAYRANDREVIATNRAKRHIEPLQQADGSCLWIDTTKVPLRDAQGNAYGVLGVYEDITEKKKVEDQLRLSQYAMDNGRDGIFLIDEGGRFHFVNERGCRGLGYSREEFLALQVSDVFPAFPPQKWREHWDELRDRGSVTLETAERTRSGRDVPVEIGSNHIVFKDTEYDCAFVRDITERREAEEERRRLEAQLRQSQKMEAIGTLAGGVAHDFNNILSIIFGYAELAQMTDDGAVRDAHLGQVLLAAQRAKELVQQILAFGRKSSQQRQLLHVSAIVKEALKMLRASLPATIEIRQAIRSDATVVADPTEIHQVLMNLCTNAYHAMRETGGVLAVSLDEVDLSAEEYAYAGLEGGRHLRLEVNDTGCGMDPEVQEKIFEPYFTTKEKGEGTGLGLAVVHGIVKSHHGHITVSSEPGRGTTVRIYLPLADRVAASPAPATPPPRRMGRGEHVLFVDDEEQLRSLAAAALDRSGYRVTVLGDGELAWRAFEREPERFDLLVTDMTLPGMNGFELGVKVLARRPELRVILCTGFSSLINREQAMSAGFWGYFNKPMALQDLLAAIEEALHGPRDEVEKR